MRNLLPYKDNAFNFHKDVIRKKRNAPTDPTFKTRVTSYDNVIENKFEEFENKFINNRLEDLVPVGYAGQEKDTLHKLYKYKSKILKDLKDSLTKTVNDRKSSRCQNCTISEVNSFDHFLPKDEFAEYSVNPKNLFPSCTICNSYKGAIWRENSKRVFLNLYIDILPKKQYLFIDTNIKGDDINITYKLSNINHTRVHKVLKQLRWSPNTLTFTLKDYDQQFYTIYSTNFKLFNLINNHYHKLHLCTRFKENSGDIITELDIEINRYKSEIGIENIKKVIVKQCNDYSKIFGFNYWESILKLSLINDPNYISRF